MKQIKDFDNVQPAGSFERPAADGYVCIIRHVEDHPDKEFLHIEFDIAEGKFKGYAAETAERGMLTLLKTKSAAELKATANISEGLENRILAALAECATLPTLYDTIKTKRYSHAKLRRAIASAALGLPAGLPEQEVFGANESISGAEAAVMLQNGLDLAAHINARNRRIAQRTHHRI